jgi:hypothetical protein
MRFSALPGLGNEAQAKCPMHSGRGGFYGLAGLVAVRLASPANKSGCPRCNAVLGFPHLGVLPAFAFCGDQFTAFVVYIHHYISRSGQGRDKVINAPTE